MLSFTIPRHCVPCGVNGLSPLQTRILQDPAPVRVFSAPTGSGKSYALFHAAKDGKRVLFVVPTRRLAQNLRAEATRVLSHLAPELHSPVALWSSDDTAWRREQDPGYRVQPERVSEARAFEDVQLIIATPESVASLLLRGPRIGHGSDPFSLSDLMLWFDHIVFDEFHSIDPRGFGLCATVARACAARHTSTCVTFLSATPIELVPSLRALGIRDADIAVGAETVLDDPGTPGSQAGAGKLRALHGDVTVTFVSQLDLGTLLLNYEDAIRACLAGGQQLVVILDSLEELLIEKERLAVTFDRLGVVAAERLAINSIDDNARMVGLGRLFTTDRAADPSAFKVLLATSSVEMGVTFKAGMIVMDPGHDALSFVQRIGRVARGDEIGTVVVRVDPARFGRSPWLRAILVNLRSAPDLPYLPVSRFGLIVLQAARDRFDPKGVVESDDVPRSFRTMPQRAVWAACLFWHALERGQARHLRGQLAVLNELRPTKVKPIAALLRIVEGEEGEGGFGRIWARAFLDQAATLRDFAPTLTVVEPDGTVLPTVPVRLIESRPALAAMPIVADAEGGWVLHLDRSLDTALRTEAKAYRESLRTVLLPNGQTRTVPAQEAAGAAVREMRKLALHPGATARDEARLDAAIRLVQLSGLVPGPTESVVDGNGAAVL